MHPVAATNSAGTQLPTDVVRDRSHFYRPELDVLRLVAFLGVFLYHACMEFLHPVFHLRSFWQASAAGLQLFFFLSAYLITELLLRERETTGHVDTRAFFMRRILRIWPLYFLFVGVSFLTSKLTHITILTTPQFLSYMLLAGNWWAAVRGFIPTIAGPLWSISVEEQYYLLWPFVARFGRRKGLWAACFFFLAAGAICLLYLGLHHAPRRAVWCNSFVEFLFFAAGAIVALTLHRRTLILPPAIRITFLVAATLLLASAEAGFHIISADSAGPSALLLGYALLLAGVVLLFLGFFQAKLPPSAAPLVYLGKISYGLYVFHALSIRAFFRVGQHLQAHVHGILASILPFAEIVASLATCIVLAHLSYRFVERPFLLLKGKFTVVRSRIE